MKTSILKCALMCLIAISTQNATAQSDLGSILNNVLGNSTTNGVVSGLTSIFSSNKQATKNNLVGTWVYEEPAIVLTSDNVLTNAAAKVAAKTAEKKLQEQMDKVGIKKGTLSMTFKSDGTSTETFGKKTYKGKWTVENQKLKLTHSVRTITLTTQVDGNNLMFVTDASKLLSLMKTLGSKSTNSTVSTVTSLMKKVKGMQCGITLVKK